MRGLMKFCGCTSFRFAAGDVHEPMLEGEYDIKMRLMVDSIPRCMRARPRDSFFEAGIWDD